MEPSEQLTEASPKKEIAMVNEVVEINEPSEPKQDFSRLGSNVTEPPVENKEKIDEEPVDPRIKFNKELQQILRV